MKNGIGIMAVMLMFGLAFATDSGNTGVNVTVMTPPLDCSVLSVAGTYNLTQNVSINDSDCFTISTNTVTIDCNGYTISGNNASGKYAIHSGSHETGDGQESIFTVKNCNIVNFDYGIYHGAKFGTSSASIINTTIVAKTVGITVNGFGSGWGGAKISNSNIYADLSYALDMGGATGAARQSEMTNSTFTSGHSTVVEVNNNYGNPNTWINNTFISVDGNQTLVHYSGGTNYGTKDTWYWNNFTTTTGIYLSSPIDIFILNTTIAGHPEGNIYANVIDGTVDVYGTSFSTGFPALYYGTSGAVPYTSANSGGKLSSGLSDAAPLTNQEWVDTAPVMQTATITPTAATIYDSLIGYCNATDIDGGSLTYHYKWYLNDVENASGTSASATQGVELNVANITSGLELGQNWTLECTPDDGTLNGTAMNSSVKTISALACRSLNKANTEYVMTKNVAINNSNCFTLSATNVTLDCAGHSITGDNGEDMELYKGVYTNAGGTVKNCVISGFGTGIATYGETGALIQNNTITVTLSGEMGMTSYGIGVFSGGTGADKTTIVSNTVNNTAGWAIAFRGNGGGEVLAYWNNVTASDKYFEWEEQGSSVFNLNTTINGNGEGNIYANVVDGTVNVIGTTVSNHTSGYYIGSSGTGIPYNAANSGSKLSSPLVDNAPLTPFTNVAPVVESVSTPSARDVTSCNTTALPVIQVNVSDADGYADVSTGNTYVNISNGNVTHQSATCVEDSHDTNWILLNCTGAAMNFYDVAGAWTITAYSQDALGVSNTLAGSNMTYNAGTHMILQNDPITFGSIYSGINNTVNTNAPALNVKNCGNIKLNMTITGANITDGGSNIMSVASFRIDDDNNATDDTGNKAKLVLSEAAQDFSKTNGFGTGASSTWDLYSFVNVPVNQAAATYTTGTWTFIASAYE